MNNVIFEYSNIDNNNNKKFIFIVEWNDQL